MGCCWKRKKSDPGPENEENNALINEFKVEIDKYQCELSNQNDQIESIEIHKNNLKQCIFELEEIIKIQFSRFIEYKENHLTSIKGRNLEYLKEFKMKKNVFEEKERQIKILETKINEIKRLNEINDKNYKKQLSLNQNCKRVELELEELEKNYIHKKINKQSEYTQLQMDFSNYDAEACNFLSNLQKQCNDYDSEIEYLKHTKIENPQFKVVIVYN